MELRKIKMFLVVMTMLLCFSCEREVYISDKMYLRQMNYKEQSNNEVKGSFFMFYGSIESNSVTTHKVKVLALNKSSYSFYTFDLKDVRIFINNTDKPYIKVVYNSTLDGFKPPVDQVLKSGHSLIKYIEIHISEEYLPEELNRISI